MQVARVVNSPVSSNSYVVWREGCNQCIVVDPGSRMPSDLIELCSVRDLTPALVVLTHHHFDHVWGTDIVRRKYGCKIACSIRCAERLGVPQNYFNLLYFNDESMFSIKNIDFVFEDIPSFEYVGFKIAAIPTPGHTDCSACIAIDGSLFTGDTIMNGYKPFIKKLHGGSKDELKRSVKCIFDAYSFDTAVYPGHGDGFLLKDVQKFYKDYFS